MLMIACSRCLAAPEQAIASSPEDAVRAAETARGEALMRADTTGTFRGFPFSGRIWYTRVFVRRDGRWQAVAMQQTSLP